MMHIQVHLIRKEIYRVKQDQFVITKQIYFDFDAEIRFTILQKRQKYLYLDMFVLDDDGLERETMTVHL